MPKQKNRLLPLTILAVTLVLTWGLSHLATANEATTSPETAQAAPAQPSGGTPQLDGATVYAWSCGSCHSERRPKEHTDADWQVIATHMRVRANLTAPQARAVLDYLQENN